MALKTMLRHIVGYIVGIGLFMGLIPYGLWRLSTWDWTVFSIQFLPWNGVRILIAAVLFLFGLVFVVWSNIFLLLKGKGGPTDIAGVRVSPRTKELVVSGPYRHTRNPMVFGVHVVYMAICVYFNSLACLVLLILFFIFPVKKVLKTEEKRLLDDFGDAYLVYQSKTPLIVPFLWK